MLLLSGPACAAQGVQLTTATAQLSHDVYAASAAAAVVQMGYSRDDCVCDLGGLMSNVSCAWALSILVHMHHMYASMHSS